MVMREVKNVNKILREVSKLKLNRSYNLWIIYLYVYTCYTKTACVSTITFFLLIAEFCVFDNL